MTCTITVQFFSTIDIASTFKGPCSDLLFFFVLNVAENLEAIEKGQAGLPFRKDSDSDEDENVPSPTPSTPLKKDIPSTPQKRVEELVSDYVGNPLQQYDVDQEYVAHVSCCDDSVVLSLGLSVSNCVSLSFKCHSVLSLSELSQCSVCPPGPDHWRCAKS